MSAFPQHRKLARIAALVVGVLGSASAGAGTLDLVGHRNNFGTPEGPARGTRLAPAEWEAGRADVVLEVDPSEASLGQTEFRYTLPRGIYIGRFEGGGIGPTQAIYFEDHQSRVLRLAVLQGSEWALEPGVEIVWNGGHDVRVRVELPWAIETPGDPRGERSARRVAAFAGLHREN